MVLQNDKKSSDMSQVDINAIAARVISIEAKRTDLHIYIHTVHLIKITI